MTYDVPITSDYPNGLVNSAIENVARKMIMLEEYWKQSLFTHFGLDHDINFFATDIVYVDPVDTCYSVYVSYPSAFYDFEPSDFKPDDPNCIDYESAYSDVFTSDDTQWIEGLSNNTSFFTFLDTELEVEGSKRFMGVETKSDVFIGAYEMFASMSVLKNLIEELTLGTTASFWVYSNTQVKLYK